MQDSKTELEVGVSRILAGVPGCKDGFELIKLKGDASYRSYFRIVPKTPGAATLILMQWDPALTTRSEEATGKTNVSELPFLNLQRYLAAGGIRVPAVIVQAVSDGMLVLEDLGDQTMERAIAGLPPAGVIAFYKKAIDNLVAIQFLGERNVDPGCLAFQRAFDFSLYMWEFDHFAEFCIEARSGATIPQGDRSLMTCEFEKISRELDRMEKGFTHRDYQSRNLMVKEGKLYVIDFQDALKGPPQYDLVALLKDSYVNIPEYYTEELVEYYMQRRAEAGMGLDGEAFRRGFKLQTVQRKLKDAGRFVFIDRVKNNPSFLPHIPQSLEYVWRYLSTMPELEDLKKLLVKYVPEFK